MKPKQPITVIQLDERGYAKITKLTRNNQGEWQAGLSVTTDQLTDFERDLIQRNRTLKPAVMPLGDEEGSHEK